MILFLRSDLQHIEQDERVSMGVNGDLYFSHAVEKDSRRDYCCFAAFPRIRTIVQKTAMSVIVKTSRCRPSFVFVFTPVLFGVLPKQQSADHFKHVSTFIATLQKPSNLLCFCVNIVKEMTFHGTTFRSARSL